jgi:hypothetical protein
MLVGSRFFFYSLMPTVDAFSDASVASMLAPDRSGIEL